MEISVSDKACLEFFRDLRHCRRGGRPFCPGLDLNQLADLLSRSQCLGRTKSKVSQRSETPPGMDREPQLRATLSPSAQRTTRRYHAAPDSRRQKSRLFLQHRHLAGALVRPESLHRG